MAIYNNLNELIDGMKAQMNRKDILERAIVRIYNNQTRDEKQVAETRHVNGIGFTGADAAFLTSLATWILSGKHLSEKQFYVASKKMKKYARQLVMGSIDEGKIVYNGHRYATGEDAKRLGVLPKFANGAEEDVYWSNKFAEAERQQEEAAYRAMKW